MENLTVDESYDYIYMSVFHKILNTLVIKTYFLYKRIVLCIFLFFYRNKRMDNSGIRKKYENRMCRLKDESQCLPE